MLVITRREGEEVVIGNPASPIGIVRIASIKGDRVRIAFEFPREVAVHRKEVAEQILAGAVDPTKNVIGKIRELLGFQEFALAIVWRFQIARSCCSTGNRRRLHESEHRQFHHALPPLPHRLRLLEYLGV